MKRLNRNPRDEELLKKITIRKTPYSNKQNGTYLIEYRVWLDNNMIGGADYIPYYGGVANIAVDEEFQRRGVASCLYDYIEKDLNIQLEPTALTEDGEKFWNYRLKSKNKSSNNLWQHRLKKNPMKTRSKISKRKSSCKCKNPCSLRRFSCSRRKNPLDGKIPTREFRNLNPDKYYIFHLYGNVSQWGKPVLSDPKRFIVESNSERTIHFWEDLLNVYGPFNTSKQVIDAWKKLLNEGYL